MIFLYEKYIFLLLKAYGQKYVAPPILNFLTKFGYYCNYYVVIWRNKFEFSLKDSRFFHPFLGRGL
jgi:hypothetical protein